MPSLVGAIIQAVSCKLWLRWVCLHVRVHNQYIFETVFCFWLHTWLDALSHLSLYWWKNGTSSKNSLLPASGVTNNWGFILSHILSSVPSRSVKTAIWYHPPIFCTCLSTVGSQGSAGADPSCQRDKLLWKSGQVTQRQTTTRTYGQFRLINENTWTTCKLHTERPEPRFELWTFSLWGISASLRTTLYVSS